MRKIVNFIILNILVFACFLVCASATAPNPDLRVGLYYDTTAMISANLQNKVGYGYRLGYYNNMDQFISVWEINSTNKITMAKDANLYYADSKFYATNETGNARSLGAYHVQFDLGYQTAQLALAASNDMLSKGVPCFVSYINGMYYLRTGAYATESAASTAALQYINYGSTSVVGEDFTCVTVYNTDTGAILFEFDYGVSSPLAVYPSLGEVEDPLTWFKGYQYYGAFEYVRNGGNISVINRVPMQEYIKGVVPYEMSASWPIEALKAQAMCARTYAYSNFGKHGSNFDICATTHCQVYHGANSASENSDRAVNETYGQYILYDGEPINAVFHSSNGGATEDSENVWGSKVPYLRGVYDPHEDLDRATNGRWTFDYTPLELQSILTAKGYETALITDAYVSEYTAMGNVKSITFVDANGKKLVFSKERARTIINSSSLKKYTHSQRFTITKDGKAPDNGQENLGTPLFVNNSFNKIYPATSNVSVITGSGAIGYGAKDKLYVQTANGKEAVSFVKEVVQTPSTSKAGYFTFTGTGWGHNVGLSQNGALAMANKGYTAEEIVKFYYTGVSIT